MESGILAKLTLVRRFLSRLARCIADILRHAQLQVYALYAAAFPNTTLGAISNYMSSAWIAFANNLQPNRPNREYTPPPFRLLTLLTG